MTVFRTFLFALLILMGTSLASQDGFVIVTGRQRDVSSLGRMNLIGVRFLHAAETMFHRNTPGVMPEKKVSFVPATGPEKLFGIYEDRGMILIRVPENLFYSWAGNAGKMDACARTWVSGRIGADVKQAARLPDSWIFAAMVRHASLPDPGLNSFGKNPGTAALVPSGIVPPLGRILKYPASPGDGACRMIYEEWAWVLYELCRRNGVFRTDDAERFLMALVRDPAADQEALFLRLIFPGIRKRISVRPGKKKEITMEDWFREGVMNLTLDRTLNAAPGYLETEFRKILETEAAFSLESILQTASESEPEEKKLPGGKQDPAPEQKTAVVPDGKKTPVPGKKASLDPEQRAALGILCSRLRKLMLISPGRVSRALGVFTGALNQLKVRGGTPAGAEQVRKAEAAVLKEMQYCSSLQIFLRDAECRYIAPGPRFTFLLSAMNEDVSMKTPLQIRAGKLLDRYER